MAEDTLVMTPASAAVFVHGLTDWFDSSIIPVHEGVYQRLVLNDPSHTYYSRYEGGVWFCLWSDAEGAATDGHASDYQADMQGHFKWRGVAADPNA